MAKRNQNESGDNSRDGPDANPSGDSGEHVRFDGGNREDSGNAGEGIDESHNGGDGPDDSGNAGGDDGTDSEGKRRIFHRKVTPEAEEANRSLLRLIANLEHCEVTDLPPLYDQIDHMVEHLFTEPPPPDAQAELEFTYHGYRIELDQSGNARFMKISEEAPVVSDE